MGVLKTNVWMEPNLFAALFLGLILSGGEGMRIRELRVPDVILNGTNKPVVLDCDYVLDTADMVSGLVVKWYFNNHPAPVYQWIVKQKPQVLGVLKGKVNLDYRASAEESTMYRAIEIITPTTELSGEYKCTVSTFDQEDSKSKKMIVYVQEKSLELTYEQTKDKKVTVCCSAEGIFPKPDMTISVEDSLKSGENNVSTKNPNNSTLFDIEGYLTMNDAELNSPTTFICDLTIPDANYRKSKHLAYFPGPPTTPSVLADSDDSHQTSGVNGSISGAYRVPYFVLCALLASWWSSL